ELAGDRAAAGRGERDDAAPAVGKSAGTDTEAPRQGAGPYRGHTFRVVGDEKQEARNIQQRRASGVGGEYGVDDTNDEPKEVKVGAPGVPQANLSRIAVDPSRSWEGENGIYKESVFGSYVDERAQIATNMASTDGKRGSISFGQS